MQKLSIYTFKHFGKTNRKNPIYRTQPNIKAIRKDAEDKYSSKITVDVNAFKALTEKHLYDKHLDYNQTVKDYYECEFSED